MLVLFLSYLPLRCLCSLPLLALLLEEEIGLAKLPLGCLQEVLYIWFFMLSLIIFFTYFWTATQFRPDQIASDMKKNGAFIPGIRQGKPTQDYLRKHNEPNHIDWSCFLSSDRYFARLSLAECLEFHKRSVTFLAEQLC